MDPYDHVEVTNPSDGGFWHWLLKLYAFAACCLAGLLVLGGIGVYFYFATTLPTLPSFSRFRQDSAESTLVRAWDGTPLAEFASERREILPFDAFPQRLVEAFVAIEDRRFYEHSGVDYRGMLRAALGQSARRSRGARGFHHHPAGGRAPFCARPSKTLQRKIREAILARRLETRYTRIRSSPSISTRSFLAISRTAWPRPLAATSTRRWETWI